jgi:hypothetical protein
MVKEIIMRSLKKNIGCRVSINHLIIGKWYKLITIGENEYIFKFNGFRYIANNRITIGRDYSYCLNVVEYGSETCSSICDKEDVRDIWKISRDDVLKYFDEIKF